MLGWVHRSCVWVLFADRVGHEIRNPLHGVSAGIEACLSGELPPDDLHTELVAVADSVRVMTTLLNDVLDLQKMRTGKFAVTIVAACPRLLVQACVRAMQPAVPVPIEVTIAASVPEWVCRAKPRGCIVEPERLRRYARMSSGCARSS